MMTTSNTGNSTNLFTFNNNSQKLSLSNGKDLSSKIFGQKKYS